jgi:hypothetical protein
MSLVGREPAFELIGFLAYSSALDCKPGRYPVSEG